jgi:hypothetical protein
LTLHHGLGTMGGPFDGASMSQQYVSDRILSRKPANLVGVPDWTGDWRRHRRRVHVACCVGSVTSSRKRARRNGIRVWLQIGEGQDQFTYRLGSSVEV